MRHQIYVASVPYHRDRVDVLRQIGFLVDDCVANQTIEYDDGDNGVQPTIRFESFVFEDIGPKREDETHEQYRPRRRKRFNPRTDRPLTIERTVHVSQIDPDLLAVWIAQDAQEARLSDYERGYKTGYDDGWKEANERHDEIAEEIAADKADEPVNVELTDKANQILDDVLKED